MTGTVGHGIVALATVDPLPGRSSSLQESGNRGGRHKVLGEVQELAVQELARQHAPLLSPNSRAWR
jgi:hypothetical protein